MALKLLLACVVFAACTSAPKQELPPKQHASTQPVQQGNDEAVAKLRGLLTQARKDSDLYLAGTSLPNGAAVRALVETDQRAWWETLTPVENFLLFEISPTVAARAPAAVRAHAYCAGVSEVSAEWWSTPGSRTSETTQHLIASGTPVGRCLVDLFDNKRDLHYIDGESELDANNYGWTVADLAGGIVALLVGEKYDSHASSATRTARRAELRAKVR